MQVNTLVKESALPRSRNLMETNKENQAENSDEPRFCPHAKTVLGYDPTSGHRRLIPLRCKRWTCDFCRCRNVYALQKKAVSGSPSKLLTLTTRPRHNETAKECHDRCRPAITRLIAKIRQQFGPCEAAVFLERTKKGMPHWHCLLRTGYIPQKWISQTWMTLTGAYIVDVREIKDPKTAASYVVKYVLKEAKLSPANRLGRLVSFTRKYLPARVGFDLGNWVWELARDINWWDARARLRSQYEEEVGHNGFYYTKPLNPQNQPPTMTQATSAATSPARPPPKYHLHFGPIPSEG